MKLFRALLSLALVAALGLSLSACGGETNDSAKPGETSSPNATPVSAPTATPIPKYTPSPTPTTDSKKSARGNLIMSAGDIGTISSGSSKSVEVKFSVSSIAPVTCDQQYSHPAENGNIMAIDLTVETTPELANSSYPTFSLSSHDFKYIADNGTTFTGSLGTIGTYSCIADSLTFPSAGMGPAEKLSAKVLLDLPAPHGILVLKSGIAGGFEYKF